MQGGGGEGENDIYWFGQVLGSNGVVGEGSGADACVAARNRKAGRVVAALTEPLFLAEGSHIHRGFHARHSLQICCDRASSAQQHCCRRGHSSGPAHPLAHTAAAGGGWERGRVGECSPPCQLCSGQEYWSCYTTQACSPACCRAALRCATIAESSSLSWMGLRWLHGGLGKGAQRYCCRDETGSRSSRCQAPSSLVASPGCSLRCRDPCAGLHALGSIVAPWIFAGRQ